jgi:hypothetical protein
VRKKRFGGITVAGVKQKEEKNRGAQLLFVLAMLVTGFGASCPTAAPSSDSSSFPSAY